MQGGLEEEPCWPDGKLERYEVVTGRPCPFVELDPSNALLSELVTYVLDERFRNLLPGAFDDLTADFDTWERQRLRHRLARALNRPAVTDAYYPELKQLREYSRARPKTAPTRPRSR